MNVVIAGANGFIGSALAPHLIETGHIVTGLVRNPEAARHALPESVALLPWSPSAAGEWRDAVASADVVVNLAGASIAGKRWSPEYKKLLRDSRIESTRAIVEAMRDSSRPGRALLNMSAVGYYGDGGDRVLTEADLPGAGFMAALCVDWETEACLAREFGARVVLLRTGIVLGEGGALAKMLPPFRLGIGGPLGSGRQWMSWIHREDAASMIAWAAQDASISGPLNVTAPNPVTMKEFASTLGRVLRRPGIFPVPGLALRLLLGEFADALLTGQRVLPKAAESNGFTWRYPTLETALRNIISDS
jgi:uncharacterized protein (TIGR01777 family)